MTQPSETSTSMFDRKKLRHLYHGGSRAAIRFQATLLVFDALLIAFFIVSPFLEQGPLFLIVDYVIAAILFVDLCARAYAYGDVSKWLKRPLVWADIVVLLSLLVPNVIFNMGFLRILRAYTLVNSAAFWRVVGGGRWADTQTSETVKAIANLFVFVFMMSSLVHTSFAARVPTIKSYMDSLYFTITSLSTTGYGDIILPGFWGRLLSMIIMIGGVTLFFRLVSVVVRTPKVRHPCHSCGLLRHDPDAVYCKACGEKVRIIHDND
ncbi:ion transporter [bacterium]|nr:ion transporter [bacterium]